MSVFERVKEIPLETVVQRYTGCVMRGHGSQKRSACPIHGGDNKTAFVINVKKNVFDCKTRCGGGSNIDFVMRVFELSNVDAANKLANDFNVPRAERNKDLLEMKLERKERQFDRLLDRGIKELDRATMELKPFMNRLENEHQLIQYGHLYHKLSRAEYYLACAADIKELSLEDKVSLLNSMKELYEHFY